MSAASSTSVWRAQLRTIMEPFAAPAIWAHGARTAVAALLALWLAFTFQLETPYSAMTTVLIVSNPVQGMILAKSVYRFGGTLIGGVAGVALIALFAQTPVLFLFGFAFWLALATAASTLLRGFRSYGAVLAGYTVALICMPAVDRPASIFTLAMARVAVVSLGIFSSALVGALFTGQGATRGLDKLLRAMLADLFAHARVALKPGQGAALRPQRRAIGLRLATLESSLQFAAAENPQQGARLAAQRDATAAFYGALTAAPALSEALEAEAMPEPFLATHLREAEAAIDAASAALAARDDAGLTAVAGRLAHLRATLENIFEPGGESFTPQTIVAADRLADLVGELQRAALGLSDAAPSAPARRNATHLDWPWARLNAVRAAVAVLLGGAIWFGLGWSNFGATMLASVAPSVALLSLRERPSDDAMNLTWGIALATLAGLFYLLWVLPQITGFPLLVLWFAPVILVAAAMMATPRLMFIGTGFGVFFITLLAPANRMVFEPAVFLNSAVATMFGSALVALVYRIVLPIDARALRRHLLAEIRRDLGDLLRSRKLISAPEWEARMHDRMRLLIARLRAASVSSDSSLRSGFAALRLGRDVLRLRALLANDPTADGVARAALASLGRADRRAALVRTGEELRARAAGLDPERAAPILRAASILPAIDALVAGRRRFFQQALQ
ncbi:MAG TPA: FUSC family protein [Rhodoblastus sp.]|nr:FUSC family protein [Rhodoblastus sp.]